MTLTLRQKLALKSAQTPVKKSDLDPRLVQICDRWSFLENLHYLCFSDWNRARELQNQIRYMFNQVGWSVGVKGDRTPEWENVNGILDDTIASLNQLQELYIGIPQELREELRHE